MLPVYIDGKCVGQLALTPQGRVWRAQLRMQDIARVARLSLYGRSGCVYLGIPEPDGRGGMTLERTLRALPEGVQYCAEREAERQMEQKPEEAGPPPEKPPRHVVWMGGRPYYF